MSDALRAIAAANSLRQLEELRLRYLGRKGEITLKLKSLAGLPAAQRRQTAKQVNALKDRISGALTDRRGVLEKIEYHARLEQERIDVTLPGRHFPVGSLHPISRIIARITTFFTQFGFDIREGPEIEDEFHNFTALNMPENHPARAMHDTFYFSDSLLLRTHTSPVQIRALENEVPPLRLIAPGRVYRCDSDQTHTPMFHQVEGLVINKESSFVDLKHLLTDFLRAFFENEKLIVRFRPSYFPFTEPSAEVDILDASSGKWIEVLGCGMVHPSVVRRMRLDPDQWCGYAFGLGVERMAMLRYGVQDLRLFFDNDLSFLRQF